MIEAVTQHQARLIRESFDSMRDEPGAVALLFYGRLFSLDPEIAVPVPN